MAATREPIIDSPPRKFSASLAWVSQSCLNATIPTRMAAIKTNIQQLFKPTGWVGGLTDTRHQEPEGAPESRTAASNDIGVL